ncbi:MAG: cysteine hydrolase [Spiribacter salinus]|uniref:Cysteine hydrolase n=1 Tax=Spiribacter salinus TaxID=1335746 RepID=A0A540VV53_9GAMM|nr:MAG: cysteine hydrolase [Spiribacter salinus]
MTKPHSNQSTDRMMLRPGRTALMVIDMQNAFLDPKGSCARSGLDYQALRAAIPGVKQLIASSREAGLPIIYTRFVYRQDYCDGGIVINELLPTLRDNNALAAGTSDIEVIDELAPTTDDIIIDKNRPGAFHGTPLLSCLSGLGVDGLIICGVTTNICVETTAREAMQYDYRVWAISDATAEFEDDRHAFALKGLSWMFASVVPLTEALDRIPQLNPGAVRL